MHYIWSVQRYEYKFKMIMIKRELFALWSFLLIMLFSGAAEAMAAPKAETIKDEQLRFGVLDNALTYYIRHNEKPKGQADFYIVSHVGAIQEDDDQQGLAHFLEHMAFNGTLNMPGKEIIEYLESIGVKFGANLNASTSWDQTIYMMADVPTHREAIIDSALLILHDWAGAIDPHEAEIDKERGVIKEELRTRDNASWRSTLSMIANIGGGTKYEHRNLIGTLEGLSQFDPQSLLSFYHSWYRPDHQAIIIVGDVDVDRVESVIKELFADIPAAAADAPTKEIIRIPDNEAPIVNIFADPELQYSAIRYVIKRTVEPGEVIPSREQTIRALVRSMQNERFEEVTMQSDAPILSGGMSIGSMGIIPTLDATTYVAQSVEGGLDAALQELVMQMERTRRYGFTESELERVRKSLLRRAERSYLNRNDRKNDYFVDLYIDNYTSNTPVLSAEQEWAQDSMELVTITLEEVNEAVKKFFSDHNNVIIVNTPLKEGLDVPSEEDVLRVIAQVRGSDKITAYEDADQDNELISEEELTRINSGKTKIKKVSRDEVLGTTEYLLSNGIEVVVKPTTFRQDEISMRGYASGGASVLSDELYYSGLFMPSIMAQSGVAEFSAIELSRHLSGVIASVSSWVNGYSHGVSGLCSPSDLESMLQLLYLTFTSPRFDETDFNVYIRQLREGVENQTLSPDYHARKQFDKVVYNDHYRQQVLNMEMVDGLKFEDMKAVHDALYSDGDDFRFVFVGNVDIATFEPLMTRYLGALPTNRKGKTMNFVDDNVRVVEGKVSDRIDISMEQPKVTVQMLYSGESIKNTLQNRVVAIYLRDALANQLLESVREDQGGSYGVGVRMSTSSIPYENYSLKISYDTNVEQVDDLQDIIRAELQKLADEGTTVEQISKTSEYLLKSFGNSKEYNSTWMNYIEWKDLYGFDYITDYEGIVRSVSSNEVQEMMRTILAEGNNIEVYMYPR